MTGCTWSRDMQRPVFRLVMTICLTGLLTGCDWSVDWLWPVCWLVSAAMLIGCNQSVDWLGPVCWLVATAVLTASDRSLVWLLTCLYRADAVQLVLENNIFIINDTVFLNKMLLIKCIQLYTVVKCIEAFQWLICSFTNGIIIWKTFIHLLNTKKQKNELSEQ